MKVNGAPPRVAAERDFFEARPSRAAESAAEPSSGWVAGAAQRRRVVAPQQLPLDVRSELVDGRLVGGAAIYPSGDDPRSVPAVMPSSGPSDERVVYVNGIGVDPVRQHAELQLLANHFRAGAVGVHNSTRGLLQDAKEFVSDRINPSASPKVDLSITTVQSMIEGAVKRGESLTLVGHSQGAVLIQRALEQLGQKWRASGLSEAQVRERLSTVNVTTFAGAASHWPDGPKYEHFVNRPDTVAVLFGVLMPGAYPGAGARIHRLDFCTSEPEQGVPPVASRGAQQVNDEVHGLSQHLRAASGVRLTPKVEVESLR